LARPGASRGALLRAGLPHSEFLAESLAQASACSIS